MFKCFDEIVGKTGRAGVWTGPTGRETGLAGLSSGRPGDTPDRPVQGPVDGAWGRVLSIC